MVNILLKLNNKFEYYYNEGINIPIIGPILWFIIYKIFLYSIIAIWGIASFPVCLIYELLIISGKAKRMREYPVTIRVLMCIVAFLIGILLWSIIPSRYFERHS